LKKIIQFIERLISSKTSVFTGLSPYDPALTEP
jgi:hypothetical protein